MSEPSIDCPPPPPLCGLRTLAERLHVPLNVPVTERMPEPCPCCGSIHPRRAPLRFDPLPGREPDGYMRPNPFF